jgi:hypothetical protein
MSNQRGTFAKRQREADLKDKARAKQERRAAKRAEVRTTKGPQIAWDEAVVPGEEGVVPGGTEDPAPGTPDPDPTE